MAAIAQDGNGGDGMGPKTQSQTISLTGLELKVPIIIKQIIC